MSDLGVSYQIELIDRFIFERKGLMKGISIVRLGLALVIAGGALGPAGIPAMAQGPGGGQIPPEIAAKIKLWQKYRDQHKKASDLGMTMRKIEGMNGEDGFKLDKAQSAKVLTVMKTWSAKPALTEDEAGTAMKQLNSVLTVKQIKKMTTMPSGFGRGGGGGAGAGGRPGGGAPGGGAPGGGRPGAPGGPGGAMTFPDPPKTGINPFNPNSMSGPMKDMAKKNLDTFKGDLEKQAH